MRLQKRQNLQRKLIFLLIEKHCLKEHGMYMEIDDVARTEAIDDRKYQAYLDELARHPDPNDPDHPEEWEWQHA